MGLLHPSIAGLITPEMRAWAKAFLNPTRSPVLRWGARQAARQAGYGVAAVPRTLYHLGLAAAEAPAYASGAARWALGGKPLLSRVDGRWTFNPHLRNKIALGGGLYVGFASVRGLRQQTLAAIPSEEEDTPASRRRAYDLGGTGDLALAMRDPASQGSMIRMLPHLLP